MEIISSPTGQSTAVTDALLGVLALGCVIYLLRLRSYNGWKVGVWAGALGLLTIASLLGVIAHGFKMSAATYQLYWMPLNLSLGLTIALFVVGAIYDRWGLTVSRRAIWPLLAVGVIFFGVTVAVPGTFLIFIIYEAIAMLFALAAYGSLALQRRMRGAWLITAGVLITIIAAGVQASTLELTVVWPLDHNGLFHLIQMVGVVVLVAGLRRSLVASRSAGTPVESGANMRRN